MNFFWNYQAVREIRYRPELGWYFTYGIRARRRSVRGWDQIESVHDVTTDRGFADQLAEEFSVYQLSPVHLRDTVLDQIS